MINDLLYSHLSDLYAHAEGKATLATVQKSLLKRVLSPIGGGKSIIISV